MEEAFGSWGEWIESTDKNQLLIKDGQVPTVVGHYQFSLSKYHIILSDNTVQLFSFVIIESYNI